MPVFLILLLLSACSSTPVLKPVDDPQASWQQRRQWLAAIENWDIEGRIAIRSYDQAVNANLHWKQDGDVFAIEITGPLGQGGVSLHGERGTVRLISGDVDEVASDAQELLFLHTGYVVPIDALKYWIRGLPQPNGGSQHSLDDQGRLAQLSQDQWKVRFRAYELYQAHSLPKKVFVDNHQLSVRIVIDKWSLPQS
ncbi:MAG: lipoprotein insertase outer membrane protein LolB [Gammaproteobacteria bacterium]|nr:lipoprotein insertase outer membrane protein LolB [Gammaproteobacteria bacterium]